MKIALVIPTYNEQANISQFISEVFVACRKAKIDATVIVVDDNSPDGTANIVGELKKKYSILLIKREGKLGIGTAYIAGFKRGFRDEF